MPNTKTFFPDPRFGGNSQEVFGRAIGEADRLHHPYIGTEHLLLALIQDQSQAGTLLRGQWHVHLEVARRRVKELIGLGTPTPPDTIIKLTPRACRALGLALQEAKRTK